MARQLSVDPTAEIAEPAACLPRDERADFDRFNGLARRFGDLVVGDDSISSDISRGTFFIPAEDVYPELIIVLRGYTSPNSAGFFRGITTLRADWSTYDGDDDIKPVGITERLCLGGLDEPTTSEALEFAFTSLEGTLTAIEQYGRRSRRRAARR